MYKLVMKKTYTKQKLHHELAICEEECVSFETYRLPGKYVAIAGIVGVVGRGHDGGGQGYVTA